MSLDAVLALMPDRTQVQLILLNAKRGFGLGELDVSLPELLVAPIADVRAQEIGALRERGPIIERGVVIDAEAKARRAALRLQDDREAGGGALVLLEDASDLSIHSRRVERFLGARKASREAFERLLDPPTELVVHRMLFAAPVGGAAQDYRLVGLRMAHELDLDAFAHRPPAVATGQTAANFFSSDFGAPMM